MKARLIRMTALAMGILWAGALARAADPPETLDLRPAQGYLAQVYWAPPGYWRATTPAASYAMGFATMMRARGEYNLLTARARITRAEARRYEMENRLRMTELYFQMRELNREYRARLRGPRPTPEELARLAEAARPDPLSPGELNMVTGEISWPVLLQTDRYAAYRVRLESLFAERAGNDPLSPESHLAIDRTAKGMLSALKRQVWYVPQMDYVAAKRFLQSLAYEARQPTTG